MTARVLLVIGMLALPAAARAQGQGASAAGDEEAGLVTATYVVATVDEDRREIVLRRLGLEPGTQKALQSGRELRLSFDEMRTHLGSGGVSEGQELTVVIDEDTSDIVRVERE